MKLVRERFKTGWVPVVVFMILVTVPTFWVVVAPPTTEVQASLGTLVASLSVGVIGLVFLTWERVPLTDVGLGGRAWIAGLLLFLGWWIAVTVLDLASRAVSGGALASAETLTWSGTMFLKWASIWIGVGFGEELAFRAYLHNKLVRLLPRRWVAILLAAFLFGAWHIPSGLATGGTLVNALLAGGVVFTLFSFLLLNLPYEWSGLLPFVILFHGWNDFPLLLTLQPPSVVGLIGGYVLVFVAVWAYRRWFAQRRQGARADPAAAMLP